MFLQKGLSLTSLACLSLLLQGPGCPVEGGGDFGSEPGADPDQGGQEWGSGTLLLQELLHSFPADSPFVLETPGKPANCSQRFWLPSSFPVCWDSIAGPEEFEHSRLLVLQNRAALQTVSQSSGAEEGGLSYNQQVLEEVQGIRADHLSMEETMESMRKVFQTQEENRMEGKVFLTQEENRVEGKETVAFSSIKEHIAITRASLSSKEHAAVVLEGHFSSLEKSLHIMQHRLNRLTAQ
ncbi:uncharacterized protein si:ch211-57n23.1 [Hypomesus transpacificus]|uniref:uncharacterized protein si:ch211-57n23.1 n=1 Tax=Hypomesus transpacificus TaxID=137520 RepID=UPI001F07A290|nr:uncharacterized protein si:ch211-57n23.1 [Hypomesus transpacificus]XP_046875845.1 uncharacterized protein si:ch211-57n23.1 [Hypomesus transpacificus]XP_046875846.1 uncharacterized protein si:ch211-57n23.1 [Hypomesus transpacificus]